MSTKFRTVTHFPALRVHPSAPLDNTCANFVHHGVAATRNFINQSRRPPRIRHPHWHLLATSSQILTQTPAVPGSVRLVWWNWRLGMRTPPLEYKCQYPRSYVLPSSFRCCGCPSHPGCCSHPLFGNSTGHPRTAPYSDNTLQVFYTTQEPEMRCLKDPELTVSLLTSPQPGRRGASSAP